MPWSESRKRPFSTMMDIYAGPEDFMEAGARGFLITTLPEREEPAIDQAMKMLRKACVKLHGGTKPQVKSTTALFSNGYIAVDFMDPEDVKVLPNTELKTSKTTKDQGEVKKEEDNTEKSEKNDKGTENAQPVEKEVGDEGNEKEDGPHGKEDTKKEEEMEKEGGDAEEQDVEMEADKSVDKSTKADDGAPEQDSPKTKKDSKEAGGEKKKEGDDASKGGKKSPEKRGDGGGKSKADSQKSKSSREDERRKRDNKRKRREVDTTPKWPLMKAPYKFKAFRTELRHIMFIKSNIPDPLVLIIEIMDLLIKRKPLKADSINQLIPIQGICNYSYWELEVMSRRVLAPFFLEDVEEPPSFAILLYDKLSEPGADVLAEIVRCAIWSINPMAWQTSPLSEADVTIHLELIGSKIILGAMTHYMKYRQYSPFCVAELGEGKPEDPEEQDRRRPERERFERSDRKGRSRSRTDRPHKTEETSSDKGKEKDKGGDSHGKEDAKKDEKDKVEESVKEETKEEGGEKAQEEATESVKEEAAESNEKGGRKTRRGKRGGSQKRKE